MIELGIRKILTLGKHHMLEQSKLRKLGEAS